MEKKNSKWNALARRGASLLLVVVMLLTGVTLPEIDWQKGEATTVHGIIEAAKPIFSLNAENITTFVTSSNIEAYVGYNDDENMGYLSVTNKDGVGVNMLSAYGDTTSLVATASGTVGGVTVAEGDVFSVATYESLGNDAEAYANMFGNAWFNTHPAGIANIKNGASTSIDYSGIASAGEGLIHFNDIQELNWVPARYGKLNESDEDDGSRYAYFLIKYKTEPGADVPRMRVWGYGDQYGESGKYQNNRASNEGLDAYLRNYTNETNVDAQTNVVFSERDFYTADGNIQYQIIWTDVVNDGSGIGIELDSFALEINGADKNDFGWATDDEWETRSEALAGDELLIYEIAGFNSENDAISYMYRDIYDDGGKFTEKAYRTETLINAPQKVAIGDTVKSHTNNLLPGAILDRGLYVGVNDENGQLTYIAEDSDGNKTPAVNVIGDVTYLDSVYKTNPETLTVSGEDITSSHQPGHVAVGNAGYLETLTYKVNDGYTVDEKAKYFYRVSLNNTANTSGSQYENHVNLGTITLTTPLQIVDYANDPSLSAMTGYTYAKTGHNYYHYDMDFAYMDAYEGDTWSIENFIYYLRSYNADAEHLHEDDTSKINDMPGYFHTSTGSMTYDLGPAISDNYETIEFVYNNVTGDSVDLTLHVTTYASVEAAKAGTAIGTKSYTKTVETPGRGVEIFTIPKYEAAEDVYATDCGASSYVQNFAITVKTNVEDELHTTTFDINDIVFAKRHTVEVAFKNEVDRNEHNAWDFNNKAIGVSHETVIVEGCGSDAHEGTQGTVTYEKDSDGNYTDKILVDNSNNIYYNIENLACDAYCQFINFDDTTDVKGALGGNPISGSEKVSVYAVQQSDYNFAYNIEIGTVSGIANPEAETEAEATAGKDNKLIAQVGHINYEFSMYANTVINIKVLWQNYANNIQAGMGIIDGDGSVDPLDVYAMSQTTTDSDISAYTSGDKLDTSTASGDNPPVITGVEYVRDSNKPTYYMDGTVTVTLDPYNGGQATDIYMYYGDANGNILEDYMHFQRQQVPTYAKVVEFDMVENTVIPAAAKSLVIMAKNMSGATANSCSTSFMILLANAGCKDVEDALGTPAYAVQVVSDTHIGKTNSVGESVNTRFTAMLNDILDYEHVGISHGIVIDGDLTDNGEATQYQSLLDQYQAVENANATGKELPRMFWTIGNHDWNLGYTTDVNYLTQFCDYTGSSYDTADKVYDISENPYYFAKVDASGENPGALYIYLADETGDKNADGSCGEGIDGVITQTQINWLRDVLATHHVDGMPIFVFFHQAVYNTVAGSLPGQGWDGVINHGQYDEIEYQLMSTLASYEEAIYFSGHSHWDLNSPGTYYQESDKMCDAFNTGSVGYLWSSYGDEYTDGYHYEYYESEGGSQGYYVEVYADGTVLVRGRDFEAGKWMPSAQFIVEPVEDTSVEADKKGWYLTINKTEFEYGEKVILTSSGYDEDYGQFLGIKDSSGNIIQKGVILDTGEGWIVENESAMVYPLAFSTEIVRSSVPSDMVPGVVYSTDGTKILPPGTYTAFVNGYEEIQFTVKESDTTKTVYDTHITIEKDTFAYGETISIGYGNTTDGNWIGIYASGATIGTDGTKQWSYVTDYTDTSINDNTFNEGFIAFNYPSYYDTTDGDNGNKYLVNSVENKVGSSYLLPGEYFAVILNEYTELSEKLYFTVEEPEYYVESTQDSYKLGEQITLNYIASGDYLLSNGSIIDVSSYDVYVAISEDWSAPAFSVLNAKIDKGAGTVTFDFPSGMTTGEYAVRLMVQSSWEPWTDAVDTISVVEGDLEPALSLNKSEYLNGEDIVLTYTDIYNGTLAIYDSEGKIYQRPVFKTDANGNKTFKEWTDATLSLTGSGTYTIDCPDTYIANGSYYIGFVDSEGNLTKAEFTVVSNDFSISLDKNSVRNNETITITYRANGTYSGDTDSIDVSAIETFYIGIWPTDGNNDYYYVTTVNRSADDQTLSFTIPDEWDTQSYFVNIFYGSGFTGWCLHPGNYGAGRNYMASFTVNEVNPTLSLNTNKADLTSGTPAFMEDENLVVTYTGSAYSYRIAIVNADYTADNMTIYQVAYTTANGQITFNNGGTTDPLDADDINGVHFNSAAVASLPIGTYKIVVLNSDGNVMSTTNDTIMFSIEKRNVTIKLADDISGDNKTATLKFNTPTTVEYNSSTKGYFLVLSTEALEITDTDPVLFTNFKAQENVLQLAYTTTSGSVVFNNYYTDRYDNQVAIYDETDYDVVTATHKQNLYIGEGTYYVQMCKTTIGGYVEVVTDPLTVTYTVKAGETPDISPEIPEKKYTYVNNEYVGVKYTGAGWGYWMAVYHKADAQYNEDGTYTALTNQDPYKNGSDYGNNDVDVKAIMRAWINGDNDMVEMNNALNFSGSMDTGTSGELPMFPEHLNGVEYINPTEIVLGSQTETMEYTVIMFNENNDEVDRFDITVTPPGTGTDDDAESDAEDGVVGYIGQYGSEAGYITITVESGDSDTNVIEYSTKKTFTAVPNDGYMFVGWYDLTPGGVVKSLISDNEVLEYYNFYTGTITVWALFVEVGTVEVEGEDGNLVTQTKDVTVYDVNFVNDAGLVMQSVPSWDGSAVSIESLVYTPPVKIGYTFEKWLLPDVDTKDVTVAYYDVDPATDDEAESSDTPSAISRYYVVSGDAYAYDVVYKATVDDVGNALDANGEVTTDPAQFVWTAVELRNITDNVSIRGKWVPASGTGAVSTATISYKIYYATTDGSLDKVETDKFEAKINVNAYVDTDVINGYTFIGWVDYSKPISQSYVIKEVSADADLPAVDATVEIDSTNADGAEIKIYSNGTVKVNGNYYPIVSYNKYFYFRIGGDMDLQAVYAKGEYDVKVNAKPSATISHYAQYQDISTSSVERLRTTVNAIVTWPNEEITGYELVEYGYLNFMSASSGTVPTTVFYDENGDARTVNFLSLATVADENSLFAKTVINKANKAGQYYGYVSTSVKEGRTLFTRPYAIYKTAGTDVENANWTVAYGETLVLDFSENTNRDAFVGDEDSPVTLFKEDVLTQGEGVNYN